MDTVKCTYFAILFFLLLVLSCCPRQVIIKVDKVIIQADTVIIEQNEQYQCPYYPEPYWKKPFWIPDTFKIYPILPDTFTFGPFWNLEIRMDNGK